MDRPLDVPHRREGLHLREVDGEAVILDLNGERMHSLNATAAFIFREIDGRHTARQIWEAVVDFFDVPAAAAERDTRALLARFRELQLIE